MAQSVDPRLRVTERRTEIRAQAAAMGIDDAFISTLVETFYARIQEDTELAPIFNRVIVGSWEPHLAKMKDFWASVAFNAGRYSGRPVPAHVKLKGLDRDHFERWLALFRTTLQDVASDPAAVDFMMEKAERIADSLKMAVFGMPGLPGYRPE